MVQFIRKTLFGPREKIIFIIILLLNLIPVLSGKFFPTLDGPAHLYNSHLINHLLFEESSSLNDFFTLNTEAVPNWTGHIMLSFFGSFLPAFVAEKILLLFYLIGLPLGFRVLVLRLAPDNRYLSYLIFPFTYSFIFFLGFYNFCIALVFLMFAYNFWLKHEHQLTRLRVVQLMLYMIVIYFSHAFVFSILLLLIALQATLKTVFEISENKKNWKPLIAGLLKKSLQVFIAALIPLLFFAYYVYKRQVESHQEFIPYNELILWLKNMRPIISMNIIDEEVYTKKLLRILILLAFLAAINRIRSVIIHRKKRESKSVFYGWATLIDVKDYLVGISLILLVCFFTMPDSNVYVGYVTTRLGLLFFMFASLWLAVQHLNKWISLIVACGVLYCHFNLNDYYTPRVKASSLVASECAAMAKYIEPNSVVLPLGYSTEWSYGHFSNYLGIEKNVVILENYECTTGYFPVTWNFSKMPGVSFGDSSLRQFPCVTQIDNKLQGQVKADYVFVLGDIKSRTDSCTIEVNKHLNHFYDRYRTGRYCSLYRLKH
jgi:hypothetical protein